MIAFVDGTVEYIEETAAVINAGGFGCRIFMTPAAPFCTEIKRNGADTHLPAGGGGFV